MLRECIAGETVRLSAHDLKDVTGTPVTSGATVTIDLYNPDGTLLNTGAGAADGDDWYRDVTMPSTPLGTYTVKITAVKSGATWKGTGYIRLKGF